MASVRCSDGSPYIGREKNELLYIKHTIKHSKYRYTYYLSTHTLQIPPTHKQPHIKKPVKTTTLQDTKQMK
jgi:hypothetical protein